MFTNTFLPHVGGVARSVQTFLEEYRRLRHRVLVVAPEFPDGPAPTRIERVVERVSAIQKFNGSDFSVRLPLAAALSDRLSDFKADILHTHHPFLLGDTALREAATRGVPVVFTHHTLYEQYTHYVPLDSKALRDVVIEMATGFANRCDGVIAPSQSIADLIRSRGVECEIRVVPTGIDTASFATGDGGVWRRKLHWNEGEVVIGHVGRLAEEKNLGFLAEATARCLQRNRNARLLVVGDGPSRGAIEGAMRTAGVGMQVHFTGPLTGRKLMNAYAAMDVFAFASHSETQGLVVAEAMASGLPVVALDASGVREVVRDRNNGRLLPAKASPESMARILSNLVRDGERQKAFGAAARETAREYDRERTAQRALDFYAGIIAAYHENPDNADAEGKWSRLLDRLAIEANLVGDKISSLARFFKSADEDPATPGSDD